MDVYIISSKNLACILHIFVVLGAFALASDFTKESKEHYPSRYTLSPVYLRYLENLEDRIYGILKSKISTANDTEHIPLTVHSYISEYENAVQVHKRLVHLHATEKDFWSRSDYVVAFNPILSFQMITRYIKYFQNLTISSFLPPDTIKPALHPGTNERDDAFGAILWLQYIYDIDAHKLANGKFSPNTYLSAQECFDLGAFAKMLNCFILALQWFDVTLQKIQISNGENNESEMKLLKQNTLGCIKETTEQHNAFVQNYPDGDKFSFVVPIHFTSYSDIAHLSNRKLIVDSLTGTFPDKEHPDYYKATEANLLALCNGEHLLPDSKGKTYLKCHLDTSRHPYWKINPLKIEVLNKNPDIVQIYDIFNDEWTGYIRNLTYFKLERPAIKQRDTLRTAAYAWLRDEDISAKPIIKTMEFITGLNVAGAEASEMLQVAAYAPGALVEPHHDSYGLSKPEIITDKGDRVTTFLVYLNDVQEGGRTAFPLLGVSVEPVKNSAVYWYTNLKNGQVDEMTLHTACPVIKGEKWIATKWTHIGQNFFKRPCGITPIE